MKVRGGFTLSAFGVGISIVQSQPFKKSKEKNIKKRLKNKCPIDSKYVRVLDNTS